MNQGIYVEQLSKFFKVHVREAGFRGAVRSLFNRQFNLVKEVEDISFAIKPGEIVGFLGPNGAGKTTTMKVLTGLLYPTSGKIEVAGHVPYRQEAAFKHMADVVALCKRVILINQGRILYDGELDALVERFAPYKVANLVLKHEVSKKELAAYGEVVACDYPRVSLRLPRGEVSERSAGILSTFPISDFTVEDPPMEDVIGIAFGNGSSDDTR